MFKLPKLCWVWKVNVVIISTCLENAKGFLPGMSEIAIREFKLPTKTG